MIVLPRRILTLIAVLGLAGCAGLGQRQDFAPAPAPKLAAGDKWSYRVVNGYNQLPRETLRYEVVSVSSERTTVRITQASSGASYDRSYDAGANPFSGEYPAGLPMIGFWSGIPPGTPVDYSPALPLFRFPLAPGGSWGGTVTVTDPKSRKAVPVQVRAWVRGISRITVPAGEFDVIEVQRDLFYDDAEWWRSGIWERQIDWYAPSVNRVVRRSQHSQYDERAMGLQEGHVPVMRGDHLITELVEHAPARR